MPDDKPSQEPLTREQYERFVNYEPPATGATAASTEPSLREGLGRLRRDVVAVVGETMRHKHATRAFVAAVVFAALLLVVNGQQDAWDRQREVAAWALAADDAIDARAEGLADAMDAYAAGTLDAQGMHREFDALRATLASLQADLMRVQLARGDVPMLKTQEAAYASVLLAYGDAFDAAEACVLAMDEGSPTCTRAGEAWDATDARLDALATPPWPDRVAAWWQGEPWDVL